MVIKQKITHHKISLKCHNLSKIDILFHILCMFYINDHSSGYKRANILKSAVQEEKIKQY